MDKQIKYEVTITIDIDEPKTGNVFVSRLGHPGMSYPFGPEDEATVDDALCDMAEDMIAGVKA